MTAKEQERQNIINWAEKQPWFKAFLENIEIQHPDGSHDWPECYGKESDWVPQSGWIIPWLIGCPIIWRDTPEGYGFWRDIERDFLEKYASGFFKSPIKPAKLDPKTFSMVRKREKKYKLRYKL
jgi:hypothetical protein